jgi:PhnB protein
MKLIPTIFLPGACKDAIAFYRDALGAQVLFEIPVGALVPPELVKPGTENRMLRAGLRIGSAVIYLSDGHRPGDPVFEGFGLSIQVESLAEVERIVEALSRSGTVQIAPRKTAWASAFGTVIDRFGVYWSVESGTHALLA